GAVGEAVAVVVEPVVAQRLDRLRRRAGRGAAARLVRARASAGARLTVARVVGAVGERVAVVVEPVAARRLGCLRRAAVAAAAAVAHEADLPERGARLAFAARVAAVERRARL